MTGRRDLDRRLSRLELLAAPSRPRKPDRFQRAIRHATTEELERLVGFDPVWCLECSGRQREWFDRGREMIRARKRAGLPTHVWPPGGGPPEMPWLDDPPAECPSCQAARADLVAALLDRAELIGASAQGEA